ncbi:hypothetical protein [Pedobacter sp. B4-66]|uniref:hypothetical protein n=1 Tax=Pedobacter sp. B4-66 TaxID=2817280 RepID=UPI001BDAA4F3|nr:hypothetical protein [Pedobacter sp. B4-66]
MQNFKRTETRSKLVFITKIEDVPGGVTVAVADLTQAAVLAGTPIGADNNGLYHVVKTAALTADATNTATDYQVKKGHNFKVGDFLAVKTGAKAYAITNIVTSNANYDVISVGTTLGLAVSTGGVLIQANAESATTTSAFKYEPSLVTGNDFDVVVGGNHLVDAWRRSSLNSVNAPAVSADIKAKMPLTQWV